MLDITDEMWWQMCSADMSMPIALHEAHLGHPFVYDREYGLFYVPEGRHQLAMAILLGFHLDRTDLIELAVDLKVEFSAGLADAWLEGEGRCFKSSVSNTVKGGYKHSLSYDELVIFGKVDYILEN